MADYLFMGTGNFPVYNQAAIITTTNGTVWDNSTTNISGSFVSSLIEFNSSIFAGVISNDSTERSKIILSGDNGLSWNISTETEIATTISKLVEFNNSLFGLCNNNSGNTILVSADGFAWDISTQTSDNKPSICGTEFNNSLFVGLDNPGLGAPIIVTSNGFTWNNVTTTSEDTITSLVVMNNSLFAGTQTNGKILISGDGFTWNTATTTGENSIGDFAELNSSMFASSFGNGLILVSTNGLIWNIATNTPECGIATLTEYNNSLFAGTITNGLIYTSSNGVTWDTATDLSIFGVFSSLSYSSSTSSLALSIQPTTGISYDSATGNALIQSVGSDNPTIRGFVWDTSSNPTIVDDVSSESGSFGTGSYSLPLTSLSPTTTYYVRGFASDPIGLVYSDNGTFATANIPSASQNIIYGNHQLAQQFSFPKTASLNRVTMNMSRVSGATNASIKVMIQTNDELNNIPSGIIYDLAFNNFTDSGDKDFYFVSKPLIKANTKYWMVALAYDATVSTAYQWNSSANTNNTRYSAIGNTWSNSTTTVYNYSAHVPHDRFNYQYRQGITSTTNVSLASGLDFYVVDRQQDMDRLFNDITVVGRGDGINQVSARALDTGSIAIYGRRQQKIEDKSILTASDCQCVANTLISQYSYPVTVYDIDMEDPRLTFGIGDLVQLNVPTMNISNNSFRVITTEDYSDLVNDTIKVNLNNAKTSIVTDIDKLKKDKELQHTFGQGATNLFQVATYENADKDTGEQLDIRFYMPDETKAINKVFLNLKVEAFRAYSSTAAGSAGAVLTFGDSEDLDSIGLSSTSALTQDGAYVTKINFPPSAGVSGTGIDIDLPFDSFVAMMGYREKAGLTNGTQDYEFALELVLVSDSDLSTLSGDITSGDTTIPLVDASGYPSSGRIVIDDEVITYTGKSGNDLTGATRPAASSASIDTEHKSGTTVYMSRQLKYSNLIGSYANRQTTIISFADNDSTSFEINNKNPVSTSDWEDFKLYYYWYGDDSNNLLLGENDELFISATTQALHTHDINFGIFPDPNFGYAGASPYQAQVSGTDVLLDIKAGADGAESLVIENLTVNSSGITDLEITPYINSGVGRWYNIQVYPNVPIRIEANVYSQIYIESK